MLTKLGLAFFCLVIYNSAKSQDTTKNAFFKFSGSADAYYRYDFNNPEKPYNNFTSFTNSQNSFELGSVSFKAEHNVGKVGMLADIGFGKRADEFSYNDEKSSITIKQLFVTYSPSSKLKFTLGSWATHVGYESVDAYANKNYSMSYLFSYGPFFHTGLKADVALSAKSNFMIGIANPSDLKYASNLPKMVIAQFATSSKDDKVRLAVNYQGGKSSDSAKLYQGDVVLNFSISQKWSLGYNGSVQWRQEKEFGKWNASKSWYGNALYINSNPNSWLAFCLRTELFNDKKNVLGFDDSVFETTFSTNFIIDDLTIIPEIRFENAGRNIYAKQNGDGINTTGNFLLAVVYHF
jgi:hypothetical protein